MLWTDSENMWNIKKQKVRKQQRLRFWEDGRVQIPDPISNPSSSTKYTRTKADMLGRVHPGPQVASRSPGQKARSRAILSQVRRELRKQWQGNLDFSSILVQRLRFPCFLRNPDSGRLWVCMYRAAGMDWTVYSSCSWERSAIQRLLSRELIV